MGFNNENAARLVFDIETAPLDDAKDYIEPSEAPSNYKDPVKIADYIERANAEQLDRCSLDVDLCRVVAIGWQREEADGPSVITAKMTPERDMLEAFWMMAAGRHLIGYNCLAFDLPVLLRRSLYLGVVAPAIQIDKYKHPQVADLLSDLSYDGKLKMRGLAFYCRRFGIAVADALTGADIGQAVRENRWADIEAHVKADIQKTVALAEKLGRFQRVAEAVV